MSKRRADFDNNDVRSCSPKRTRHHDFDERELIQKSRAMNAADLFFFADKDIYHENIVKFTYGDEHRALKVHFKLDGNDSILQKTSNVISVVGLNYCGRYLELFGEHIRNLKINYANEEDVSSFNAMLATYCGDTLNEFWIEGTPATPLVFDRSEPFTEVYTLKISNTNLGNELPEIAQCFPEVTHLSLSYVDVDDFKAEFKKIRTLYLEYGQSLPFSLKRFLTTNPDLAGLSIKTELAIVPKEIVELIRGQEHISMLFVKATTDEIIEFDDEHIGKLVRNEALRDLRLEKYEFTSHQIRWMIDRKLTELDVFYCTVKSLKEKAELIKYYADKVERERAVLWNRVRQENPRLNPHIAKDNKALSKLYWKLVRAERCEKWQDLLSNPIYRYDPTNPESEGIPEILKTRSVRLSRLDSY